jgi:hypothetical protein
VDQANRVVALLNCAPEYIPIKETARSALCAQNTMWSVAALEIMGLIIAKDGLV